MSAVALCTALRQTIVAAREALAANATLDLAGFDGEIAKLCGAAGLLPPDQRSAAAVELRFLLDEIDRLAGDLKLQQAAAQRDATPRRAAAAYGKTPPGSDADSSD
ncbi:MAG: hypothetical protein JWL84_1433 [Rhodospirillales bacterium]|jgi:hypothetical protein|nr:hypothetical protein [Rhodospirillales bacterium]